MEVGVIVPEALCRELESCAYPGESVAAARITALSVSPLMLGRPVHARNQAGGLERWLSG